MNIFKKMINRRTNMTKSAENTVSDIYCTAVSAPMREAQKRWCDMYSKHSSGKSLNIAAAIASELSKLVTMEMKVSFDDDGKFLKVKKGIEAVLPDIRRYTEYACAKGGLVFKPYVKDGEFLVDYVQADCFYPTQYDSRGHISGAVFAERVQRNGFVYTRLEKHSFSDGKYTIENEVYRAKTAGARGVRAELDEVEEWADLCAYMQICNVKKPLFAYFKMPCANTIDTSSPLGVSVFARAADLIEEADRQYERLLWEFESGERALYMDSAAYRRDEKGNPVFPDKRLYRSADTGVDGLFEDWTPDLREQSILNGLDAILIKIEDVCGIARGTFSNAQMSAKTATELRILRQRSYVTVAEIQNALAAALRDLAYAMCVWGSLYGICEYGECGMGFEFDDSIIADREREFEERVRLAEKGIIKDYELRAWYLGENESKSREILNGKGVNNGDN